MCVPVAVDEHHGRGQLVVVVHYELKVAHGLGALVQQRRVLRAHCVFRVRVVVHHVGDLAQVRVQPAGVLIRHHTGAQARAQLGLSVL